ncbi:MAG: hypothetical protein JWN14_2916 [Chthonomonadales bacterium]|nr:hypothetical protein [Chthonomonadales bacterium]
MAKPGVWDWQIGVTQCRLQYTPDPDGVSGLLTWVEDVSSWDDDRGNGTHVETSQTLNDFLHRGPQQSPPVEAVEALLAYLEVQKPGWFDPYRLLQAAGLRNLADVEEMLAQGVEADRPIRSLTPLYWAVYLREYAMAERLFTAGVDVDRHFARSDETILMVLANWGPDTTWEALAQRIIAQGADLEAPNQYGETALMAAATAGGRLPDLLRMLLEAGADVNARSQHGYTPLWKAVSYRYTPNTIVEQLIAAGADVNACDHEGSSVLMEAIANELVESVRCLLTAGADVQAISAPTQQYREPKTVLQFAQDYANPEILRMIQEAGGS